METMSRQPVIRLDPRTLLALALLSAVMVMTAASWIALIIWLVLLVVLTRWMETFGGFWRWLRWVLPMVGFFGVVTGWAFTWQAGLLAGARLLGITWIGHLFFRSTTPEDMANALVKAGMPYAVAFVVGAGMQFVTVLARKAREVMEAQQARGIPISGGWRMVRYLPAFFTPPAGAVLPVGRGTGRSHGSQGIRPPGPQLLCPLPSDTKRLDGIDRRRDDYRPMGNRPVPLAINPPRQKTLLRPLLPLKKSDLIHANDCYYSRIWCKSTRCSIYHQCWPTEAPVGFL